MTGSGAPSSVLIIGGAAAGLGTARALRALGSTATITIADASRSLPVDRPPLSKSFLSGQSQLETVQLINGDGLDDLAIDLRLGARAVRLDVEQRIVTLADGSTLAADAVVLAPGLQPRWLPGSSGSAFVLHSVEDAVALGDRLRSGPGRVAVVGAGALGSEIAATARSLGAEVTLYGTGPYPMHGVLGDVGSQLLAQLHREAGVVLMSDRRAVSVVADRSERGLIRFDDGLDVSADTIVVAAGSRPAVDWLVRSGLQIDDGIVSDAFGRAAPGIWAVGDAARWYHAGLRRHVRLENRTNATEMAMAVARDILGEGYPYVPVPTSWTDQYGVRVQVFGTLRHAAHVDVTDGSVEAGRFVAVARDSEGPVGVLGWGMPKQARTAALGLRERMAVIETPTR